jgi:hypothetical protein
LQADEKTKRSEGAQMYHRDVIAKIARRLPHRTQRDVAEVVEILTEVWSEELMNGKEIIVPDVRRLSIEVQDNASRWRTGQVWTTAPYLWTFSSDTSFEAKDAGGGI